MERKGERDSKERQTRMGKSSVEKATERAGADYNVPVERAALSNGRV
jgi:hypothetical protein